MHDDERPAPNSSAIFRRPDPAVRNVEGDTLRTGFVSERRLADLMFRGHVRRVRAGVVESGGNGFSLHEAVRVIGRSDGHSDPYGLSGVVERLGELLSAGAAITSSAMRLGGAVYRIERGVIALRITSPGESELEDLDDLDEDDLEELDPLDLDDAESA